jgi:hypothetical protein
MTPNHFFCEDGIFRGTISVHPILICEMCDACSVKWSSCAVKKKFLSQPVRKIVMTLRIDPYFAPSTPLINPTPLQAKTYETLYKKTLRISVLSCRSAIFLPTYSFIMWISLVIPSLYLPMQVPIAVAEGYCFYSFMAMISNNLGGATRVCKILDTEFEKGKRPLCPCCCPTKGTVFYRRVYNALWNLIYTRTGFVILTIILQCVFTFSPAMAATPVRRLKIGAYFFTAISLILLGNGFLSLVMFYEVLYEQSRNVNGTFKILLLKFSVGLIVIQGLTEEIVFGLGLVHVEDSPSYTAEDRAQRLYCFIVLFEYTFLSILVYLAYSTSILPAAGSPAAGDEHSAMDSPYTRSVVKSPLQSETGTSVYITTGEGSPQPDKFNTGERVSDHGLIEKVTEADLSFKQYVNLIFAFGDVFDNIEPPPIGTEHERLNDANDHYHSTDSSGNVV